MTSDAQCQVHRSRRSTIGISSSSRRRYRFLCPFVQGLGVSRQCPSLVPVFSDTQMTSGDVRPQYSMASFFTDHLYASVVHDIHSVSEDLEFGLAAGHRVVGPTKFCFTRYL
ncbi:hypothetical protein MRX96_024728 [Rhipicephalus microplus]